MNPIGCPGLTPAQKKELWQRWKDWQSLSEIARALGKHPGSIHGVVKANGGIAPAAKTRAVADVGGAAGDLAGLGPGRVATTWRVLRSCRSPPTATSWPDRGRCRDGWTSSVPRARSRRCIGRPASADSGARAGCLGTGHRHAMRAQPRAVDRQRTTAHVGRVTAWPAKQRRPTARRYRPP
ncbi:MAG: hypothetical protein QOH56_3529 [Pseudonocardiales bacterium]|jgi:hypothetical protein|nr:hypothetical protein [Pseudonocardiales bacterium]